MTGVLGFVGRLLIALLFIVSGVNKLFDLHGAEAMVASAGLPVGFALASALFEIVAGLALVFGVLTRLAAVLLAGFCLLAAFFFHNDFYDPIQSVMLLKDVAIAGGLLCLCALDTVRWSYDEMRERRRAELAARKAEEEAHAGEVRAARAEGVAAASHSRVATDSAIQGRTVVADLDGDGVPEVRKRRWL